MKSKDTPYLNQIKNKAKKDIPRKTVIILLIITIMLSVLGTYIVLNTNTTTNNLEQPMASTARVAVTILSSEKLKNEGNIK